MQNKIQSLFQLHTRLNHWGETISPLVLRLFLAWEFWESGWIKFTGDNWFADIHANFPFPFGLLPVEFNWFLATWSELVGALLLLVGLATRYAAASLFIVTLVAWYSVHGDMGYNVCSNGYKMALIYIVALIPLIFTGAGRLSLDRRVAVSWYK